MEFTLPDGDKITLGNERFSCPELLFQPTLDGFEALSVPEVIVECWNACDNDTKCDFTSNTILAGGGTTFSSGDIGGRLQIELEKRHSFGRVNVVAPPERAISAWVGGSILSCLSTFEAMWITRIEYDQVGPSIVHRKCY